MSFVASLRDPVIFAIPAFLGFMALEMLSLKFLDEDEAFSAWGARQSARMASTAEILTMSLFACVCV